MTSIKKKLSHYLSISISIFLVSILLVTDISVDTWISSEFDRAMHNKVGLLETLVDEDEQEVEFDFSGEFMPEFEGKDNPEYFQLWYDDKVFERSDTLQYFEVKDLPKLSVALNEKIITDVTLPDGRQGRMLYTKFLPQIDSEDREQLGVSLEEFVKNQKPMEIAYALSVEELSYILGFVDIIFVITSIITVIVVRKIVSFVIDASFKPIDSFSHELTQISLLSATPEFNTDNLPNELIPIANAVNLFIRENHALFKREQRITSDIAHELKTPITELLNLSEVAVKFPHEKQISETFAVDVMQISTRLKNIVNSILLLQKSSDSTPLDSTETNIEELLSDIVRRENTDNRDINLTFENQSQNVTTNKFALETILSNLLNNALFYSPKDTSISVSVSSKEKEKTLVQITNHINQGYEQDDLVQFFEPLWQKDSSRTSTERYGLGLAIVKSYCDRLGADISVSLNKTNLITFSLLV